MARYSHEIWIAAQPEDVFDVLMDARANRHWQSGVVHTRATAAGPAGVGTTMTEVREFAGYRATIVYRLVEHEWPARALVEIVDGPLRGFASYTCTAERGGTRLVVASDVTPRGRWRYLAGAARAVLGAELAVSCQRLKALVEHERDVTPAVA